MAKFTTLSGKRRSKALTPYLIDWDAPSLSKFQTEVKAFLRGYWENYICYEEMPVVGTRLRIDFVNMTRRIALEVQGRQHREATEFFHGKGSTKFLDQLDRDDQKREWCEINGFRFVEVYPEDLPLDLDFFIDKYDIVIA